MQAVKKQGSLSALAVAMCIQNDVTIGAWYAVAMQCTPMHPSCVMLTKQVHQLHDYSSKHSAEISGSLEALKRTLKL